MNRRMLPPNVPYNTREVYGRTYTGTPGTPVTISDGDGKVLEGNKWCSIALSCPTSGRPIQAPASPANPYPASQGQIVWDETLAALIVFDANGGGLWRDPATGNAV